MKRYFNGLFAVAFIMALLSVGVSAEARNGSAKLECTPIDNGGYVVTINLNYNDRSLSYTAVWPGMLSDSGSTASGGNAMLEVWNSDEIKWRQAQQGGFDLRRNEGTLAFNIEHGIYHFACKRTRQKF